MQIIYFAFFKIYNSFMKKWQFFFWNPSLSIFNIERVVQKDAFTGFRKIAYNLRL